MLEDTSSVSRQEGQGKRKGRSPSVSVRRFGRSVVKSRFHAKLVATYLTPVILLPLFAFHNTRKRRCAYVLLLVFSNWVSRTLPLGMTALMPLIYLPALRILNYDRVLAEYMNNTVLLTMAAIMMSVAIETTNLHHRIALWVLLRFGQSLRSIMAGYTAATFVITLVLKNSATLDIMVPLVDATVHEIHYTYMRSLYVRKFGTGKHKPSVTYIANALKIDDAHMKKITTKFIKLRKVLLMAVAYTASLGSVGVLSGTVTNYVTKMILETRFPEIDLLTFMPWTVAFFPIALFEVVAALIILYSMHMRRLSTDTSKEAIHDAFLAKYKSLGNVRRAEKVVVLVFAIVFLLWFTRKPIFFRGWENILGIHTVDDTSIAFVAVAVFFAVPMTGTDIDKRILSWSIVCNKMSWGMLLTFGGGLALADASEATKLSDDFVVFVKSLNIVNPVVMQVLLSLSASFLTEFTPNDAAASMLLPVVITVACGLRINPLYLALPVSLAVTQSCILPASSSVISIMADEGHITTKDLLVPGIMVKLVCQIVNLVFINTSGHQVFRLSKFPSWAKNCSTAYPGKTVH